jgi:formate hydrogenlyase subunit 3/multisubunit Na+/H+ antiporter MnhD subunit
VFSGNTLCPFKPIKKGVALTRVGSLLFLAAVVLANRATTGFDWMDEKLF